MPQQELRDAERFVSTCSPTELKALNEVFKVNILNGGATTDEMMADIQRDCEQGHQHVFLWYTEEMYKANTMEGNSITQIDGTCFQPTWSHVIGNTTLHDAVCFAGYQLGQLHTITSNLNKLKVSLLCNLLVAEKILTSCGTAPVLCILPG